VRLFTGLWILVAALPAAADVETPHVANPATSRDGIEVVEPTRIFLRGDEDDDELFFGAINSVQLGPEGHLYVLDQQKSEVVVLDPEGAFVRTLSREGEGPGECRRPEHMVFLPDGTLGLAQYINGKIVRIDLEGVPQSTIRPPTSDHEGDGLASIRRARYRAGTFVINGVQVRQLDDGMMRTQYLFRCDPEGKMEVDYLTRSASSNLMRDGWIEKNHYFPSHERWDIDREGRVLAATERNEYRITVFASGGDPLFTFGRDHEPWKRTEDEKQEIRDALTVLRDGERIQVEVDVEDHEPAVLALYARPDGEVWVMTSRGVRPEEDGIMVVYDVFDAAGVFTRQVALALDGDPDEDRLYLLGEDRVALVRGAVQARRNTFGGSRAEEKELEAVHDLQVFAF
jgi:hypothetical protein